MTAPFKGCSFSSWPSLSFCHAQSTRPLLRERPVMKGRIGEPKSLRKVCSDADLREVTWIPPGQGMAASGMQRAPSASQRGSCISDRGCRRLLQLVGTRKVTTAVHVRKLKSLQKKTVVHGQTQVAASLVRSVPPVFRQQFV